MRYRKRIYRSFIGFLIAANLLLFGWSLLEDQRLEQELSKIQLDYNSEIQQLIENQRDSQLKTARTFKTAIFLGDSYAAGAGASNPSKRFTTIFSQINNLLEINLAEGGTGYPISLALKSQPANPNSMKACGKNYCNNYLEAFSKYELAHSTSPDYIFISGGRNNADIIPLKKSVPQFLMYIHNSFPESQIFVISPIGDSIAVSQNIIELRKILFDAVQKIPNGHYIDLQDPLLDHPEFLVSDNVHPNDAGMRAIANALDEGFRSIVKTK